ncbi:MAG: hypothetical protein IPK53_08455 [bacterium]|nr:hypothetical protein [bacterium]
MARPKGAFHNQGHGYPFGADELAAARSAAARSAAAACCRACTIVY